MTTVSHLTRSAVVGIVLGGLAIPLAASEPVDQQNYARLRSATNPATPFP